MTITTMILSVRRIVFLAVITAATLIGLLGSTTVLAENHPKMDDEELDLRKGVAWAAGGFPYNQVVDIVDGLTDKVLGRIVPDRHGVGGVIPGGFIASPFSSPKPGTVIFVSIWGVSLAGDRPPGCYVEYFLQFAPRNGEAELDAIIPKRLEIRIGSRVIEVDPFRDASKTRRSFDYIYEDLDNRRWKSTWYMTRNLFRLTADDVRILMNAPEGEVRTRLTVAGGERVIVPIGAGTVAQWKEAYKLDPTCGEGNSKPPVESKPVTANPVTTSPQPVATNSSNTDPQPPASDVRVQGQVAMAARQSRDDVAVILNSAYVTSGGTYEAGLLIENRSDRPFTFVPIFAKVVDSNGKEVAARVILANDSASTAEPGKNMRGRVVVLGRKWDASGSQNLFLVIQGSGDRNFRIPF
ncbi:hypothetical protein V2H45_15765 [Tumidithrix elongata RA019]|uniref:Uncharacterized protein n=1 Tax=Tumidithrix elongata BACA0141 TaxID=2716417 RepID=A0AAW9PZA7_9CYAN|nr:hypothetical protein [Tumidithrix elongata RA019]